MSFPLKCQTCQRIFTSRAFKFTGMIVANVENCWEDCPYCGGRARSIDGSYDIFDEIVLAVRPLNRNNRRGLEKILQTATRGDLEGSKLIDAVSEVAPEVAAIMRRARSGEFQYLAIMIFVFLLLQRCSGESLITINRPEINIIWQDAVAQAAAMDGTFDIDDVEQDENEQGRADADNHSDVEPPPEKAQVTHSEPDNPHPPTPSFKGNN